MTVGPFHLSVATFIAQIYRDNWFRASIEPATVGKPEDGFIVWSDYDILHKEYSIEQKN